MIAETQKVEKEGQRFRLGAQTTANTVTPDKEKNTRAILSFIMNYSIKASAKDLSGRSIRSERLS